MYVIIERNNVDIFLCFTNLLLCIGGKVYFLEPRRMDGEDIGSVGG